LGEGLDVCSGEMVAAHWVEEPMVEASTSGSSDVALESSVAVSRMEDDVHASADKKPYSGF
jgi:hypothetical protein